MFEGILSPSHVLIVAVIAVLLFGDRLPEVMRSVGRGVSEFKKGMRGIENSIDAAIGLMPATCQSHQDQNDRDREVISAPRFDPPTSEPRAEAAPHEGEHHDAPAHDQEPAQPA